MKLAERANHAGLVMGPLEPQGRGAVGLTVFLGGCESGTEPLSPWRPQSQCDGVTPLLTAKRRLSSLCVASPELDIRGTVV